MFRLSRSSFFLPLAFVLLPGSAPLAASPTDPAQAGLISDSQGFTPGGTFTLALRLVEDPGWHTYWRDPGDAGLPTTLALGLPPGVHAGALEWPKPRVFSESGVTCYGYESPALLLVPITVDPGFSSPTLTIHAKATWLVCKDICLPGKASPSLTLPRLAVDRPSAWAPLFAKLKPTLGLPPDGYQPSQGALGAPLPSSPYVPAAVPAVPASASGAAAPAARGSASGARAALRGVHTHPLIPAFPASSSVPSAPLPSSVPAPAAGLGSMLLLALLGGLLLNLMPCVLPVLSLKALSFVKQAHEGRARGLALATAFSAGVLASFWALAALVLVLKRGGQAVGWGFQFQQPGFVLFMAGLLTVFSLNLFGVFEILLPGSAAQGLSAAGRGSGLAGAFGQGLVMTLLATPCTAPFLGTALGFAFAASSATLVAVFTAVAVGLALPYVLLAAVPGAHAWLPKPGNWMLRFKELMGFLLLATVLWLLWVLGGQAGTDAEAWAGVWLLMLSLAAWLWGRFGGLERSPAQRRAVFTVALVLALGSGLWLWPKVLAGSASAAAPASVSPDALWQPWSAQRVAELRAQGRPVFVDFGAQWCWTCKVNERGVLSSSRVLAAFQAGNVALLKADDTRPDPAIDAALKAHGRAGVPMYLYYPPRGGEVLLPELLTPGIVLKALGGA